jgi:hypothetical protein
MLKYDALLNCIEQIEKITAEIHLLLIKGESMDYSDIMAINSLYFERKSVLSEFEQFALTDEGKNILNQNSAIINNFIIKLQENDKNNIVLLKNKIQSLANKLKELNTNKSLMIYQK